ncbi:MAG: IS21 family transposase [Polyangiaceae bacterium]|nr:IS21 family transposase [Polyangiaceae bacterium]
MMIWTLILAIMGLLMPTGSRPRDQGEMLSQLKRHEVQVLLRAGFAPSDVAKRAQVSDDSVRRIQKEDAVEHTDDAAVRAQRRIGRPSKAAWFTDRIKEWLAEDPDLPTQELLRRAKESGYAGKKTAFYTLVAGLREPRAAPVVRFEGLPGEFSQHDFGHVDVRFVDGRKKRVHFFASRLKYSRFAQVTLVENERVETILRCLARDFVAFGGLPLMAVFDRPKTIVKKSGKGREVQEFNQIFAQAIVDIGVGVEMCAPRSGNQKGSVERLVGWVKSSFFKHRKFQDEEDLRAQLATWHIEVNTQTASRATGVIPEIRRQEELTRLRPAKVFPETLALRIPVFVGPTAEVMFEGAPYSMPPKAAHVAGTLFLYEHEVHIVAGRFEARHRRRTKDEPPAPLPEHRAEKIAAVHGTRAKLYEKRQHLLNLGRHALEVITEITHREPKLASRRVEELYTLLDTHGDDVMRAAFADAVEHGQLSISGVRRALSSRAAQDGQMKIAFPTARGGVS